MVASIQPHTPHVDAKSHREQKRPEEQNRVLRILMSRMDTTPTFGENMIFMLNRAGMFFVPFVKFTCCSTNSRRPDSRRPSHATPCPEDTVSSVHDEGDVSVFLL